jgi:hypothetical protein
MPEEPEVEVPVELEPEPSLEAEPEIQPEAVLTLAEEIAEKAAVVEETPLEAEVVAEAQAVIEEAPAAEPEPIEVLPPEPAVDKVQRRAELEKALAQIPADAYDIPLAVLALSGKTMKHLRSAKIENLGQIMERLAEGDVKMLAVVGMDTGALAEIKDQVEIMVSVPSVEPERDAQVEEAIEKPSFPRFESVADDEFEEKAQAERRRKQKRRHLVYNEEVDEVLKPGPEELVEYDSWEEQEED